MKWTRRNFINASIAGAGISTAAPALIPIFEIAAAEPAQQISDTDRAVLKAAMDEIIPAGDGMPSASQAGGVAYLSKLIQNEHVGIGNEIRESMAALNELSKKDTGKSFEHLASGDRIRILKSFEDTAPNRFTTLRDSVYEAYYTQPAVWRLIGYELFPTDHTGPHLKPFDENILSTVRKKPKYFREA